MNAVACAQFTIHMLTLQTKILMLALHLMCGSKMALRSHENGFGQWENALPMYNLYLFAETTLSANI